MGLILGKVYMFYVERSSSHVDEEVQTEENEFFCKQEPCVDSSVPILGGYLRVSSLINIRPRPLPLFLFVQSLVQTCSS